MYPNGVVFSKKGKTDVVRRIWVGIKERFALLCRAWTLMPWIRAFRVRRPLLFLRNVFLIEKSLLFDPIFYREQNPDLPRERFDLPAHYVALGGKNNRDPNPLFDTKYYREKYLRDMDPEEHPLVHYLTIGAAAGCKPHPLFDTSHYSASYPDIAAVGINPLAHYLHHGVQEARNPHPLFDTEYYLLRVPELKITGINPVVHFLKEGADRGIKPHPLFYPTFYLEKYPDVAASGLNPLVHFIESGGRQGYDPNPMFDTRYYLKENPDVAAAGLNPLVHYLESGACEGKNPHPFFHTDYYNKINQDVVEARFNPLAHFVEYGVRDGRLPYNYYEDWIKSKRPTPAELEKIKAEIDRMSHRPVFSVIVPVYNTDERWLRRCLDSVFEQLYPHWELCVADDASTLPHVHKVLGEYMERDSRVRVVYRKENGHISEASNSALTLAQGDFVALLDHDDEISIDALYENAVLINDHPDADMIYSDEDKITEEGIRHTPFFKPDWSPDTHLSQMYTGHLGVYRTELVRRVGGFRKGFEGSQDYDLALRFTEQTSRIHHIPKILYHWRTIRESTARSAGAKNYAYSSAEKAIQEALDRRGEGGRVELVANRRGNYRVRYAVRGNPLISILIIPEQDNASVLDRCLLSIFKKTKYPFFEVLVVGNGCPRQEMIDLCRRWEELERDRFHRVSVDRPFNRALLHNEAVRHAHGEILVGLDENTEVITEEWLEEMAGQAQRNTIGAVGAVLLYPDGTVRHAGMILGIGGVAGYSHQFMPADSTNYFGRLSISANLAAVTGSCLMTTRKHYLDIGGLDEDLAAAYSDVDYCLRLLEKELRNIVLSHVRLYYHKTWRQEDSEEKDNRHKDLMNRDTAIMERRWRNRILNDPYYNPNLTRTFEDYSMPTDQSHHIQIRLLRERLRDPFFKNHPTA